MIVIPAVDIKNGKCVRLRQGKMDQETVYSENPEEMANQWAAQGAEYLHVVDLDGAVHGAPKNSTAIRKILKKVRIPVQVGGGLRDSEMIDSYLAAGARRVVLGSAAVLEFDRLRELCGRFPQKVVVAIDSQDGKVAVRGWQKVSDQTATDLARRIENLPVAAILVTDIKRDGMLTGPNLDTLRGMVNTVKIPVIASGGVSCIEDIRNLMAIPGLSGVIVGRALYEGKFNLKAAVAATQEGR